MHGCSAANKPPSFVRLLLDATPPGTEVIVFGSTARGNARPDSDIDLMVVLEEVEDRYKEEARLDDVVGLQQPWAEVLVAPREKFEHWRHTLNTVYYDAAHEGISYGIRPRQFPNAAAKSGR